MTAAELHPEELLDRERAGRLTDDERAALDAHSARCDACRVERALREDFAAELEPKDEDHALIERALGHALQPSTEKIRLVRNGRGKVWLLAAAAALVAVAAVAALATRTDRKVGTPAPTEPVPFAPAPLVPVPAPVLSATPAPELEVFPLPEPLPSSKVRLSDKVPSAAELFASANRARHDKRDAEAIRLYRELQTRYPDSREARASRVTLGQLLLDTKDPSRALGEFDGYLKDGSQGAVTEEAIVGRARALEKLGRTAEERAAWQELLAQFPSSVHAAQARERLDATK
jgi:TolA-binding protein